MGQWIMQECRREWTRQGKRYTWKEIDALTAEAEPFAAIIDPDDAPFFVKDYHDYYKTPRGYHPRSLNSTDGWNVTSPLSLLNAKLLAYANEIRSAVLVIHGDKAHSCYFSRDAFARLQGDNKELLLIPGAVHTDLYDRMDIIPFDRIEAFYRQYLK